MTIEQRARDLLNAANTAALWTDEDTRDNHHVIEAVCRALEAHDETQAAFDAYRREVSEAIMDALPWTAPGKTISARQRDRLSRFIIPEPVDPLTATLDELGVNRADFDAALAKIGGRIVFGEGA